MALPYEEILQHLRLHIMNTRTQKFRDVAKYQKLRTYHRSHNSDGILYVRRQKSEIDVEQTPFMICVYDSYEMFDGNRCSQVIGKFNDGIFRDTFYIEYLENYNENLCYTLHYNNKQNLPNIYLHR